MVSAISLIVWYGMLSVVLTKRNRCAGAIFPVLTRFERSGTLLSSVLKSLDRIDQQPGEFLSAVGQVFAEFGAQTQDSGNISYGSDRLL